MPGDEPFRNLVHEVSARPAQAPEPGDDLIHELAQCARRVRPDAALERAPLPFLGSDKTKCNSLSVWTVLNSCLLYFFADPVQSDRGYENALCLFKLRSSSAQVARTLP